MDEARFKVDPVIPTVTRRIPWDVTINGIAASPLCPGVLRPVLLRLFGATVARRCILRRDVDVFGPKLVLGENVFVNVGVMINNSDHITIGARSAIGPGAVLTTTSHELGPSDRRAGAVRTAPIEIGEGCWIGAGAVVLPGVVIGRGCVIAAGAVVTSDCEPDGLYAGVPARRLRDLPQT